MNKIVMITISIVLIIVMSVLFVLTDNTKTPDFGSNSSGQVTTPNDKPNDNTNTEPSDDTPSAKIENVYIGKSSISNPITQAGWSTLDYNVLMVSMKTSDALLFNNGVKYAMKIYLQRMYGSTPVRYTSMLSFYTDTNEDKSITHFYCKLPSDFALPTEANTDSTYCPTFYYYALVEIVNFFTGDVLTSNLVNKIECQYFGENYTLSVLDVEFNSEKFTSSGELPAIKEDVQE